MDFAKAGSFFPFGIQIRCHLSERPWLSILALTPTSQLLSFPLSCFIIFTASSKDGGNTSPIWHALLQCNLVIPSTKRLGLCPLSFNLRELVTALTSRVQRK